jgi:hypothetical protein
MIEKGQATNRADSRGGKGGREGVKVWTEDLQGWSGGM